MEVMKEVMVMRRSRVMVIRGMVRWYEVMMRE